MAASVAFFAVSALCPQLNPALPSGYYRKIVMALEGIYLDFPVDMVQTSLPYVGSEVYTMSTWFIADFGQWVTARKLKINKSGAAAVGNIGMRYSPALDKLVTVSGYHYPAFQLDNLVLQP